MTTYNKAQSSLLVFMRILIGWHFLYEGVIKLLNPSWTAKAYLLSSDGFFESIFTGLAGDSMIGIVDFLNIALLIMVGLLLILGYLEKGAAISGAILLLLYYLSHPAFPGIEQGPTEGSYWIVNKNLIEMAALLVLANFPTGNYFGIRLLFKKQQAPQTV